MFIKFMYFKLTLEDITAPPFIGIRRKDYYTLWIFE